MTAEEREKFYDDEIAPALLDMAKRCNERGLSFLACVEWEPGETGRTAYFVEGHGPTIATANVAIQASDNADSLISYVMGDAKRRGHGSIYLKMLGVPFSPTEEAA